MGLSYRNAGTKNERRYQERLARRIAPSPASATPKRASDAGSGRPGGLTISPSRPYYRWSTSMPPLPLRMKMREIPPALVAP